MIWLWIIPPLVVITVIFIVRKIDFKYFIFPLFSIQMYGVSVFGVTLKPYMFFVLFLTLLFVIKLIKKETSLKNVFLKFKVQIIFYFSSFIIFLLVDLINKGGVQSIVYHIYLFLNIYCVLLFFISIEKFDFVQFKNAICFSSIIFGIVFILAFLIVKSGHYIPGISANLGTADRDVEAIVGILKSSAGKVDYRLKGFCIDPNSFCFTLYLPVIVSCIDIIHNRKITTIVLRSLSLLICLICTLMSGSRTALIIDFIIIITCLCFGYNKIEYFVREKIRIVSIVSAVVLMIAALIITKGSIVTSIFNFFFGRASLEGESGRFTLWKLSINELISKNPLFGLGQGVLPSSTNMECHNTFLEFIVGNGFFGFAIDLFLVSVISYGLYIYLSSRRGLYRDKDILQNSFLVLLNAASIFLAASTISYISSPDLWFAVLLLIYHFGYYKKEAKWEELDYFVYKKIQI